MCITICIFLTANCRQRAVGAAAKSASPAATTAAPSGTTPMEQWSVDEVAAHLASLGLSEELRHRVVVEGIDGELERSGRDLLLVATHTFLRSLWSKALMVSWSGADGICFLLPHMPCCIDGELERSGRDLLFVATCLVALMVSWSGADGICFLLPHMPSCARFGAAPAPLLYGGAGTFSVQLVRREKQTHMSSLRVASLSACNRK